MKLKKTLTSLILAASIAPSFAAETAAPIEKLSELPETVMPLAQWKTDGGGRSTFDVNGFMQEGKAAFSATLIVPKNSGGYRLNGEVLLPSTGAAINVSAGTGEVITAADKKTKPPLTAVALGVSRQKDGLKVGRSNLPNEPATDAAKTWLPFAVERLGAFIRVSLAGQEQSQILPNANTVMLSLRGGAIVRNVAGFSVAALPDALIPLPLDAATNTKIAGPGADADLKLDATTLERGVQMLGDTPFFIQRGEDIRALDVKPSLSGWKDGEVRSVKNYLVAGTKNARASDPTFHRVLFNAPAQNYSAIHLLAFARDDNKTVPRLTVRAGYFGNAAGLIEDRVVNVPAWNSAGDGIDVVARVPVKMANGQNGFLFHLRVLMPRLANLTSLIQMNSRVQRDGLQIELTRDMKVRVPVPDPFEFGELPAGQPSGVIVVAATMERSPVTLEYSTAEYGNVFYDTQKVVFQTRLTNNSQKPMSGRVFINAVGPGTALETAVPKKEWKAAAEYSLQAGESKTVPLDVTPDKRGWYRAVVGVEAGGVLVQERDTSFAVLAPDTRQAMDDSPFGVWSFWDAHSAIRSDENRVDKLGSLIEKGGWRWTYGGDPYNRGMAPEQETALLGQIKQKYKLTFTLQTPPEGYERGEGWWDAQQFQDKVVPWLADAKKRGVDNHFKVLHESRSSTDLLRRYSEYLGGEPYDMPADEKARLEAQFENVKQYTEALKKADPNAKIVLINDYPAVANEYLKRGFPKENFDVIGLEDSNFMREPERQPDWLSLLGTLAQIHRIQARYGYDKPVWTTEALYHGTNPGNLDYHQQGVIYVREAMLALANGVQRMAAAGLIADSADDYYWSNWGGAGFCERDPEYNPKPSYAMYAWMTQVLDQAKYSSHLDTGSTVLHVLDFVKPDNSHVYPVWVPRGRQSVVLQTQGGAPVVYDVYGNRLNVPVQTGRITLDVSDTPQYVTGTIVTNVAQSTPVEVPREMGKVLVEFDNAAQLKPVVEPSKVLAGSWSSPFLKGDFTTSFTTEDGASTLRLELKDDNGARKLLSRYVELALAQPIELTGRPLALTVRLKGNGGWGRVMFEIVDAAGRIWTSSGNQLPGATNAADSEGESFISFDGWQTIQMPLPGQYDSPDQFVHWPRNFGWWPTGPAVDKALAERISEATVAGAKKMPIAEGHDVVTYPIKLTKVIVSMRPNVLYVNEEIPTKSRVLYLDKIGVINAAPGM